MNSANEMKRSKILIIFLGLLLSSVFCLLFSADAYAAANLSLSPATKDVSINQSFDVAVSLDTGGSNTDAADVIINYDANKLTLVTSAPGTLYSEVVENNTNTAGKVIIRTKTSETNYFTGSGNFATLTFTAKASGTATVSFDWVGTYNQANPATGRDCNISYQGVDILGSVTSSFYSVGGGSGSPTPGTLAQACIYTTGQEQIDCLDCVNNQKGNWTVFGCLPSDPNGFAAFLLRFALGIGGGVAFLGSLLGSFYLLTSAGNPERINQGKKLLFYSITGLLVIVFAVFILQFLGLNLLGIPEFGK